MYTKRVQTKCVAQSVFLGPSKQHTSIIHHRDPDDSFLVLKVKTRIN